MASAVNQLSTGNVTTEPRRISRVLFLNRSYWPDTEATGQLLTELCEDLSPAFVVTVIAGQPNNNSAGAAYRRGGTEVRHNVRIRRVWHTRFPKRFLPGRICNYVSFLISAFWAAVWIKRPDLVVVETDPPLLCLIGWYLQRVRGTRLVVYLQDIHPDIGIALGKIRNGPLVRLLRRLMFRVYRGAGRVVVLSRDMGRHLVDSGVDPQQIACLPNWIDTELVCPIKRDNPFREQYGLADKFIVMYSGNLGLCQRLEDVVAAASLLREHPDILFLFVGSGALERQLKEQVVKLRLSNIRFLPYQPKAKLAESLSAADVQLVPLDPRVVGCLMPSKLYAALASGTPLLVIAPDDCELAELTREYAVGVVAAPAEPQSLANVVRRIADQRSVLPEMGRRARELAVTHYDRKQATESFGKLLFQVLGHEEKSRSLDNSVAQCESS